MLAREIMITELPIVEAGAGSAAIAKEMLRLKTSHVLVVNDGGTMLGLVAGLDLCRALAEGLDNVTATEIMTPRSNLIVAYPETPLVEVPLTLAGRHINQVPVVEGEIPVGYLDVSKVLLYVAEKEKNELVNSRRASLLINSMREGVVVVDKDYRICELNPAAQKSMGLAEAVIGQQSKPYMVYGSPIRRVMETGEPLYNIEMRSETGKTLLTNNVPIINNGSIEGVLQTFSDITDVKQMHIQLLEAKEELDKAFALTLPNSRVEKKLKNTPEYRDVYNEATGMIEVTEVIEDGGYLHVINALKVAADLNEKGMMALLGLDKDILVQALIFHDVGKSQPALNVGQVVNPHEVFEQGEMHAFRSASIVEKFYDKSQDVVQLIRYHHHRDEDLPGSFPHHLLPMLRLLRIIDGLSAGLTRRSARIGFSANGSRLTILENNGHPDFNRMVEIDLYTGQASVYNDKRGRMLKQGALRN